MTIFENSTTEENRFQMDVILNRIKKNSLPITAESDNPQLIDLSRIINSLSLQNFCISLDLHFISDALEDVREEISLAHPKVQTLLDDFTTLMCGWASMGMYDKLTGLLSRNVLDHHFCLINELAQERQISIALIAIDANNLGGVNNFHPDKHLAGDRYLKAIGHALTDWKRDNQLVFRIGGDEFLAVSFADSHTDAVSILERVEKICNESLADRCLFSDRERELVNRGCGSNVTFSVSAGIVIFDKGHANGYALGTQPTYQPISAYEAGFFQKLTKIADQLSYERKNLLKQNG